MKKSEFKEVILDQQQLIEDLMEKINFMQSQIEYSEYKYFQDTDNHLDWKEFYEALAETEDEEDTDDFDNDEEETVDELFEELAKQLNKIIEHKDFDSYELTEEQLTCLDCQ